MSLAGLSQRLLFSGAFAALALVLACADDPIVPAAGVPGQYHATRFTVARSGVPVNLLAVGASLSLVLADDHTTAGRLIVPAGGAGGTPIDQSLSGSWSASHDTVFFAGPADTFIRDVPFLVRGAMLVADDSAGDARVQVILSK